MHWYGGSIAEAVTLSKQRNAIFVVFVEGDNDLSTEMATIIDDTAIVSRLSDESNFLAVKLKSGTVNYTHFAQIYQFVPVPSLFFIGQNGTPLEVVCAGVQAGNLALRIDRILSEHRDGKPSIQPSTSGQNIKEETANLLRSEASNVTPEGTKKAEKTVVLPSDADMEAPDAVKVDKKKENVKEDVQEVSEPSPPKISKPSPDDEVVCDGDVCVRKPKADQPSTSQNFTANTPPNVQKNVQEAATSSSSIDEKVDRAKELIEIRRLELAEKNKELEKQKELERRNTGQGVAELKRWQADQELKQIQEERKREKLENNLARQRILQQIAQDRAERKAREAPVVTPAPAATTVPAASMTTGDASTESRIQFKLPDGSSHTAHFPANDTLEHVQRYVSDNLNLSMARFALWTAFPRRELAQADATLRELQLAPSAALLVLPRREPRLTTPSYSPFNSVYTFIAQLLTSLIYEPSVQLYTWVSGRLFPRRAVAPRPPSPAVRRRNNIHRLPGETKDDDNNTWNGNSTQQM